MADKSILQEAQHVVDGPRQAAYGDPKVNHGRTAEMWNAFLSKKLVAPLTPRDVCLMMVLLKCSREGHSSKRDNLVDIAGWARNAEIVSDPEAPPRTGLADPDA